MRQFLNAFPLREGGGQRPGWMCLIEAQICAADSSFSFLRLSHKSPYRFEDPSCAFGAALLQGPTRWGLSNICFHAAYRIVSCSIVMLTRPRRYATIARRVRLWRRAYSLGTVRHWLSCRRRLTLCLLFSQSLRRCAGGLLRGRFWAPNEGCIWLWRCSGRSGRCRPLWVYHRRGRSLCRRL